MTESVDATAYDSDVTDYGEGEEECVDILSDGDDDTADTADADSTTAGSSYQEQEEIEVEEKPVAYNNSKYFNKRKIFQRVDVDNSEPACKRNCNQVNSPENTKDSLDVQPGAENGSNSRDITVKIETSNGNHLPADNPGIQIKEEVHDSRNINPLNNIKLEHEAGLDTADTQQPSETESFIEAKLEVELKEEPDDWPEEEGGSVVPGQEYLTRRARRKLRRLEVLRRWEKTGFGKQLEEGTRTIHGNRLGFRILSYNILCPSTMDRQRHLFRGRTEEVLGWEYRLHGLLRELASLTPDIACLQEVQFDTDDQLAQDFLDAIQSLGYEYRGRRRRKVTTTATTEGGRDDGCAILYKPGVFRMETWRAVEVTTPRGESEVVDCVGVICRLRPVNTRVGNSLVVGTGHLPYGEKRFVDRLSQMGVFLADLDEIAHKDCYGYHPTILTGDFNLEPFTDVHRLIMKGKLVYRDLLCGKERYPRNLYPPQLQISDTLQWTRNIEKRGGVKRGRFGSGCLTNEFYFRSVYHFRAERDLYKGCAPPQSEVTTWQGRFLNVDYIFYSTGPGDPDYPSYDGKRERNLKLVAKWRLPTGPEMAGIGGLPSYVCPSDHLPLVADFCL